MITHNFRKPKYLRNFEGNVGGYVIRNNNIFSVIIFLLFITTGGVSAFAQEQEPPDTIIVYTPYDTMFNQLNEVVITGTRVSKKIIDIPYSVVRINNLHYRYDKTAGVNDVLASVPGMFMQSRYGNHDVRISIRGFGSKSNSGIRGVRILLDDIPESEPDGQTRIEAIDFNSIGRIEIAKGNSSSLYTNAPGGVVNFINDIDFPRSFGVQFNQFGSFGLRRNGLKLGIRTDKYGLLNTYSYQQYDGFREHNTEHWHILNTVVETRPSENTSLKILFYFVDGMIRLPGSLTKEEFEQDPYQADPRALDRDLKRLSTKGRLGIRYNARFGKALNNEIEITTYATIKYFERTSRQYRIINRQGMGFTARYVNTGQIGRSINEFSFGGDLLFQPARTEFYDNISGQKGDQILQLLNEKIGNTGFYVSDNFEILKEKFFVLLTGRYDNVTYRLREETLPSRSDSRNFSAFTPKLAFNYKLAHWISLYTSYGFSFDSPAKNELESVDPGQLYNHELNAQESRNVELGIKGYLFRHEHNFLKKILFEVTLFNIRINNEIVPFEVFGDVFFRNAAKTNRRGLELGTSLEIYKNLNFTLAYTFSDFAYQTYIAKTIEIDNEGNITEEEKDFTGNIVPSVPKNNIYLGVSYSYPFHRNVNGFIKFSYTGISGLWVDDANTDKTDAYHLLNSVLGLDMEFGKFNILLSGSMNNMLDVVYVGFTNTNSADRRFYEAGEPRNYFASLNLGYRF
ncbi:MAG: TonB-dependent receptor [Bacteroidetes bacterium]|nr:TonB-dependent receptor [Bacteroidota bacterium]MCK5766415.1 TonB-dependent receptor [Bacteroidales bacterium]